MNLLKSPILRMLKCFRHVCAARNWQITRASTVNLEQLYRRCRINRQGAAAVEFALVAPVFLVMVFGMIEFGRAVMVQQLLVNAAREGVRVAVLDGTTAAVAQAKATSYLSTGGVSGATVSVMNENYASVEPSTIGYGKPVIVKTSVPFTSVSWLPSPWFLRSKTLTATAIMRRETVQE